MGKQVEAQKLVEERARARRDKFFLANDILGYDFQPDTHAELFACYTKYKENTPWVEHDEIKNRLILWSRGHYKTTAVVVEVIQAILNFPDIRVILMQGSVALTKTLFRQIKSHFIGEAYGSRLKELFPEFCGEPKELGPHPSTQFIVPCRRNKQLAQATVTVASPRSVKTGSHYDLGVFDDLVTDQNFRNPKLLEKVTEDFTLAQSLIDPGGYRLVSGTRYAFGDTYEQIIRWQAQGNKWIISVKNCWTDESQNKPDHEKVPRFPRFTKKSGQLGGFTREDLLQMQADDPATFACQYLNQPIHFSKVAFTEELWEGAMIAADDAPVLGTAVLMVDLASGESENADDSVIAAGKSDRLGVNYLVDMRGGQWMPMELAMNVIDMTLRHRPSRLCFENTASCKYFVDYLRMVAREKNVYLPLEMVKVNTTPDAKNTRVVGLAGKIGRKRFRVLKGLPKLDRLKTQSYEFPKSTKSRHRHDDYPDTAALLDQELSNDSLAVPLRQPAKHPILAMMADRENALVKMLTQQELAAVSEPDVTGLEV